MNRENTLNILNGQVMFNHFTQHHLDENNVCAPFNEAICVGEVSVDIFSNQFNQYRCNAHHITMEQYQEKALHPLRPLFNNQFEDITLWFDDDMFCQINLLTLLAYLDQIRFTKKIIFNLVNHEFKLINHFNLGVQGYHEIYKQVLINKCIPQNIPLSIMEKGIRLYLEYIKEENEITAYIRKHKGIPKNEFIAELFRTFPQYGLGDIQYLQLIQRCRISN
jgi:hypothetical protein